MGKDFKGKELGEVIVQRANGTDRVRFVDKFGKRRQKKSRKHIQESKQILEHLPQILILRWMM